MSGNVTSTCPNKAITSHVTCPQYLFGGEGGQVSADVRHHAELLHTDQEVRQGRDELNFGKQLPNLGGYEI